MPTNPNPTPNAADTARAGETFFGAGSRIVKSQMAAWAAYLVGLTEETTAMQNSIQMQVTYGNNQAVAAQKTYDKDADQLRQQRNEQIGQACVGAAQGAVAIGSMKGTAEASKHSSDMDNLVNKVNEMPARGPAAAAPQSLGHADAALDEAPSRSAAAAAGSSPEREAALKDYRTQIAEKGFNYKQVTGFKAKGFDQPFDEAHGISLKDVFDSASDEELPSMRKGLASSRKSAHVDLQHRGNEVQFQKGLGDAATSALGAIPQAVFKEEEAKAMNGKAKATFDQTLAQNELSMAQQVAKSQGDQIDALAQAAKQVPRTLAEVARAEFQG